MTNRHGFRPLIAASTSLLLLLPIGALALPASAALSPSTTATQAAESAGAVASDFLYYKYPTAQVNTGACLGIGVNITEKPFYSNDDCGFTRFTLTGTADTVETRFFKERAQEPFATALAAEGDPGSYTVDIEPPATWDTGRIRMAIFADGEPAGESTFGHNLLGATIDAPAETTYAQGVDIPVSGDIVELDNDGPTDTSDTGGAADFTLQVTRPNGTVLTTLPVTAEEDGTFAATIPAAATAGIRAGQDTDYRTVLGVNAIDAAYTDPDDGLVATPWTAENAGSGAVTVLSPPDSLQVENSFVSSVGWVKPGETYPSRIDVSNPTDHPFNNVEVTVTGPAGSSFGNARTAAGEATLTDTTITWSLGSVPAAGDVGPTVRSLVIESEAATLTEDPQLVWKDLSSTATLKISGVTTGAPTLSHGPKVIPPSETYDTARYGDRPFPVVPVDYLDRAHQPENSGDKLATVINSPDVEGSTYNLFQEMSLGQLFPNGTVPSAGIASRDFAYEPGFDFTALDPQGTCHGATVGSDGAGSPLYGERIRDGFYQLPGTTDYYGDDRYGSAVAGAVAGVGPLMDIDSACGPTGKLVYDAAAIADPEIDYSDYDTDKDGVVDFFMVVYAGCGGHGSSQLSVAGCAYPDAPYDNVWPHSSSLESYYTDPETGLAGFATDDQLRDLEDRPLYYTDESRSEMTTTETSYKVFVRVGPYNVNPETAIDKASVISHEYGHSLGLPDFYSLGSRETYGDWNLMATDKSQNMDVFSRQEMGWIVPEVLEPGTSPTVNGWTDSKQDTDTIKWQSPDGTPYTLSESEGGPRVQNSKAYVAKLPGRQLIDPAKFDTGDKASKTHAWWSGSGNDFGCPPQGGHNLDVAIPGLKDLPEGTTVKADLKSLWDVEWDYDYGYVLTSGDGGETYTSHASENGYTSDTNPNQNACQGKFVNGLTGSSGSYQAGSQDTDRLLGSYEDSVFLADSYDISDLAGSDNGVLRFAYATDPGLARPGWFIDDLKVTATTPDGEQILLDTDLEGEGGPDDPRFFNGGCKADLGTARTCTKGWNYIDSSAESPADHAYYLELRDRSGFDLDSNGQNDRDPIGWAPGLSMVYTDEAHGYGNVGTDNPPAQTPLDSQPEPDSDTPDLNDAAWTATSGDSRFTDLGEGHTENYSDPSQTEVDPRYPDVDNPWRFQFGCLAFDVLSLTGATDGPDQADGDLSGDVAFNMGSGCGEFDYGYGEMAPPPANTAPTASASGTPQPVTAGKPVSFSALGSTDTDTPDDLDYAWDFDTSTRSKDAGGIAVRHTYPKAGTYTARLTVTDPDGATDTADVQVVVDAKPNGRPTATASARPTAAVVGEQIRFSGARSTDPDTPNRIRYSWNFDNGGATQDARGKVVNKEYRRPGVYSVILTVTDPSGAVDTDRVKVRVRRR